MEHTLGTELRMRREALGMGIDDLAREARISAQYVRALEESGYHLFSAKVYAQGAVRRMSRVFESNDTDALVAILNREWPQGLTSATYRVSGARRAAAVQFTPRSIGALAAAVFVLFLFGFWGLRIFVFAAPPMLAIESPADRSRTSAPVIPVSGRTEKESMLTVNGREIRIDEGGSFSEDVQMQLGVNMLRFVSESRFGKTSEEIRYILVE